MSHESTVRARKSAIELRRAAATLSAPASLSPSRSHVRSFRQLRLPALPALLLAAALTAPAAAAPVDLRFDEFTLPNGLRVVVHTDRKAPIVAVNIWYHVGSKDEPKGRSGFAHLFEHLMFQGSENHRGEFFEPFELVGATDQNGTTNTDRTNYFQNVPTTALDMALWMESDRMGHLLGAIDQKVLDEQRGVVQNEKRQGENQPYGQTYARLTRASYPPGHPYHHTVIGSMADLNAATLDDVKNWFKSWYGPNNAVLVLAGDIDVATARTKVARYFGHIPPTAAIQKLRSQIAPRRAATREQVTDTVPQTRIYRVWNVPGLGPDADRLELLAHVLGGAQSSRLDRRFVHRDKTADRVTAQLWPAELGGMFVVQIDVKAGGDVAAAERALDEELRALLTRGPTAEEVARARSVYEASFIRGLERIGGFGGKADVLASCTVYTGKPGCFRDSLATVAASTPAQLRTLAATWLARGDHTLIIAPGARQALPEDPAIANLPASKVAPPDKRWKALPAEVDRKLGVPKTESYPPLAFPKLARATLSNGLRVVLAERRGLPLVQMQLQVEGAGMASDPRERPGLASFAMGMLDEGAGSYSALALGDRMEELGAQLSTGTLLDHATLSLSALSSKLEPSLALFADVLLRPTLDTAEIERTRGTWLSSIAQEKAVPLRLARRLSGPLVYGAAHPYSVPPTGTEAAIRAIQQAELRAWVKSKLRPDRATLIIVGDATLAELTPKLEAALAGWKATGAAPPSAIPTAALPAKPRLFLVDQPGAIQASIFAGLLVPGSTDGSAIDFEMANAILGGEFTSRLNMNLREDKHWAYGSYSAVGDARGQRLWRATASVQIDKTVESLRELDREIREYATGAAPAKPEELSKIKATNIRTLPGSYETAAAVLETMSSNISYGRPDDYAAKRAARITALEAAQIQAAAKAIKPAALTWIIVGDLSKIEAGIRGLKLGEVKVLDADGKVLR
jgi:predicted Zn-dependent peptidase